MIVPGDANTLLLGGGYKISRSLRFRYSASAYLTRTSVTPTDNKKCTWSGWIKRGSLNTGAQQQLFSTAQFIATNLNNFGILYWDTNNTLVFNESTTAVLANYTTAAVFRDTSAWYHVVLAIDTTAASSTDRVKIYINGVNQSLTVGTAFALNASTYINAGSLVNTLNSIKFNGVYFQIGDQYLAEVNYIDGQALTPASFGTTDPTTNVWAPIRYTGTYGANGFYLPFTDTTSATTLSYDKSGNGNNFTPVNISTTAGITYDSMKDSPTPFADGTVNPSGNYCVMNPNLQTTINTYAQGNLFCYAPAGLTTGASAAASMGISTGKWYFEATYYVSGTGSFSPLVGVTGNYNTAVNNGIGTTAVMYASDGQKFVNGVSSSYGAAYVNGDVIGVAVDLVNGTIFFSRNGTWQASGDPVTGANPAASGLSGTYYALGRNVRQSTPVPDFSSGYYYNFGQRPFNSTPPTGYIAINSQNLATPTIINGGKYMAATLYTGSASTQSVTNAGNFKPDLVWVKDRTSAQDNKLTDVLRGVTKGIISNTTGAETTDANGVTAFNSNGFSLGTGTRSYSDSNADSYVAWQWLGGGTGSSNTSGSITSTVSANTSSGFSIVSYTGTGANATVGHGLGVAPQFIIVKQTTAASTTNWASWHTSIANTNYLLLNTTAASTSGATYWNSTSPTSTVFSIGSAADTNTSSGTYIAYCFTPVAGYSIFGSYTGNASTSGPFVYTGFRPRYILIKRTDSTSDWYVWDTARNAFNVVNNTLFTDTSGAETSATSIDILSNGFVCRSATVVNVSAATYIYAAFAENPLKYVLAR